MSPEEFEKKYKEYSEDADERADSFMQKEFDQASVSEQFSLFFKKERMIQHDILKRFMTEDHDKL